MHLVNNNHLPMINEGHLFILFILCASLPAVFHINTN